MVKNKLSFVLAATALLTLGSCGGSSTPTSSATAESSSSAASRSSLPDSSSSLPSSSSSEEEGNGILFTLNADGKSYSVVGYKGGESSLTIPNSYRGLPVKEIGKAAFSSSTLHTLVIPEGVVKIGAEAFANSFLASITIPSTLKKVGGEAFAACGNLSYNKRDGLEYLPSGSNPYFLLVAPESTDVESAKIAADTPLIADGVFASCHALNSLSVDSANPNYSTDGHAIFNKDGTTLHCYAPGTGSSYVLPDQVTAIQDYAFYLSRGFQSVTLPASLIEIGEEAFSNCSLTSIALPASLTHIGDNAFSGCASLSSFAVDSENANFSTDGKALYDKAKTELIQYATASTDAAYTLPDSLLKIDGEAFADAKKITSVAFPLSLTSIGSYAFASCASLTDVTLDSTSLTNIEEGTFTFCTSLAKLTLPNSLTAIGDSAFWKCSALTTINVPSALTDIGKEAFRFSGIESLVLPDSLTTLGALAFSGCKSLVNAVLSSQLPLIPQDAFSGCTSLTKITLPSALKAIREQAFGSCGKLSTLTYPNTKANWATIYFDPTWKNDCPLLTSVTCTDGTVAL
jgi:hypothetical protein